MTHTCGDRCSFSEQRPPGPPDGHPAAVLPRFDRDALAAAMRRARGQPR
jgi:hypothetical protein